MLNRRWVGRTLLVLGVLLLAACGGKSSPGLILYQPADEAGQPALELVVVNVNGDEQRRIPLSGPLRMKGVATQTSYRALFFTEDGAVYLVDARDGTAQKLDLLPQDGRQLYPNHLGFSWAHGKRWTVLGDVRGNLAYLADLKTGQVTDLVYDRLVFFGRFSPDDAYLALAGDKGFWLVPTSSPEDARRLDARNVRFSNDGRQIVYIEFDREVGEHRIVVEAVDGSESEVVFTADSPLLDVAFGPRDNQLFVRGEDALFLLNTDDGTREELLPYDPPAQLQFSSDGTKLVFGYKREETMVWYWIDLTEGTVKPLDNLPPDYPIPCQNAPTRQMLFAEQALEVEERHYTLLNLESGEAKDMALSGKEAGMPFVLECSGDGRFGLVLSLFQGAGQQQRQLWLLDVGKGQARLLAQADEVRGALSPDGQWVAVNTIKQEGETAEPTLTLVRTEGEETRPLGAGYLHAWVRP